MALRAASPDEDADPVGAFVPGGRRVSTAAAAGPLAGLTFAVKDVIDVAGLPTGAGNPDWLGTHRAPARSAPVVEALLAAGATCVGKTITDELAFSLEGVNVHYGTPINPAARGRLPGGSSSGSAAAVAAGLVDFALGTDTGGSVRVPAAFCGVFGFRPTHGRIPVAGVVPLAPSYDVVGWMARDGEMLWRVGQVLTGPEPAAPPVRRLLARDALALCDAETAAAMRMEAMRWGAEAEIDIFAEGVDAMLECYRVLQGAEIWRSLGPWVRSATPRFGDAIRARFEDAAAISGADVARWLPVRAAVRNRLDAILADGSALIVPTAPGPALPIAAPPSAVGDFYRRALCIGAVAGHAGLPQVGIPLPGPEGLPIGLSLIAGRGRDAALLSFARQMA